MNGYYEWLIMGINGGFHSKWDDEKVVHNGHIMVHNGNRMVYDGNIM